MYLLYFNVIYTSQINLHLQCTTPFIDYGFAFSIDKEWRLSFSIRRFALTREVRLEMAEFVSGRSTSLEG